MNVLDIGVDLDGVLYNFENDLQAWAVMTGHNIEDVPLPSEGWDFWKAQWGWDLQKFLTVCNEAADEGYMFSHGTPEPGALDMMDNLKVKGHHLHIITSRSFGTRSPHNTVDWLNKNDIPYDSLVMTHHKNIMRPDIMIDDYETNFYGMWSVGVETWLRDQAWNQHVLDNGYRVFSLAEFENRVDRKAEA